MEAAADGAAKAVDGATAANDMGAGTPGAAKEVAGAGGA